MALLDFQVRHAYPKISSDRIHVLLKLRHSGADLNSLGFSETSRAGDIVAGAIPTSRLEQLRDESAVVLVEGTRQIKDELDDSIRALRLVDSSDARQIPTFGAGAIIGIIDSGFELTHPCFFDSDGKTRIFAAWDQVNESQTVGRTPSPFGYGTEYCNTNIDELARKGQTLIIRNHPDAGAHGMAVAGIAAGNGIPFDIYQGIAPEADLVLVSYRNDGEIGGSAFVLDAISYILAIARYFDKPVVINLSQGDNLGAHDGSSLLELAIDHLLAHERLLIVNSAGNGRTGKRHTEGCVPPGKEHYVNFRFKPQKVVNDDTIDIWYSGVDRFSVALRSPTGYQSEFVPPDRDTSIDFPDGGTAHVYSELDYPTNHDNRISVVFGNREDWGAEEWALVLRGDRVQSARFHAWTDRPDAVSAITFADPTDNCIVTLPGTAEHIITVSGFVSRPVNADAGRNRGELAGGASLGPTRDNRVKPNLTAPSSMIMTLTLTGESNSGMPSYVPRSGTSMAAPHVTGIIALLWALKPSLGPALIRDALYASAATDEFTGQVPNAAWGRGKADAQALYKALFTNLDREKVTMSTERIPLELNIPDSSGNLIAMSLEILIRDGDIAGIQGRSGTDVVDGTLYLRKRGRGEGGDQCWVCGREGCREVTPCPK